MEWERTCRQVLFFMPRNFGFADELGHGAHRAVHAPAAWLVEDHGGKTENR